MGRASCSSKPPQIYFYVKMTVHEGGIKGCHKTGGKFDPRVTQLNQFQQRKYRVTYKSLLYYIAREWSPCL